MKRIAIVGIGRWGKNLVREFSKFSIISKCITTGNPENIKWLKKNYPKILISTNIDEILNDNNIDFFIKNVQPEWIHFSGCKKIFDRSSSNFEAERLKFDRERVEKMIKMSKNYSFSMGAISSDI